MIKNNFFIPIIALAILVPTGIGSQYAFAHVDPAACDSSISSWGIQTLRSGTPFLGPLVHGETIDVRVKVQDAGGSNCSVDGGGQTSAIGIRLPGEVAFTTVNTTFPCVGGDSDADDNIGLANCGDMLTEFLSVTRPYQVDCTDVVEFQPAMFGIVLEGDINALFHTSAGDSFPSTLDETKTDPRPCVYPEYDFSTQSSPGDNQEVPFDALNPVKIVTDTITFTEETGVVPLPPASFTITRADLWQVSPPLMVGSIGSKVTCIPQPNTNAPPFSTATVCTFDDTLGAGLAWGKTFCWDVETTEDNLNYKDGSGTMDDDFTVQHNGCPAGVGSAQHDNPEGVAAEIFRTAPEPVPYNFSTQSNPGNNILIPYNAGNPVDLVTDTITFTSAGLDPASFTITRADLWQVSPPVKVGALGGKVMCTSASANPPAFSVQAVCTFDDTLGAGLAWGKTFCWDVQSTEGTGNYLPSVVNHNGCPAGVGTEPHDSPEGVLAEIFRTAKPTWSFETLSDPTGTVSGPVPVVTDTITISGDPATPGEWSAVATLYLDGDVAPTPDGDGTIVCLQHPSGDPLPAVGNPPQQIRCTWDANDGGVVPPLSASGTYCWMVTVTDASGNYVTVEDSENACAISGENNEPIAAEQFTIAEEPEIGYFVGGGRINVPFDASIIVEQPEQETKGKALAKGQQDSDTFILTHGFELHCDEGSGPNNLEVNWLQSQFHLEQLEHAVCVSDDSINEPPPSPTPETPNGPGPTLDVYYGEGYGRYNGECGAYAGWVFDDNSEPGKGDHIVALVIWDKHPNDGGLVVLDINYMEPNSNLGVRDTSDAGTGKDHNDNHDASWYDLVVGNHQWVPHPEEPHGPLNTDPCDPEPHLGNIDPN